MRTIDDLIKELKVLRSYSGGDAKVKFYPEPNCRYPRPLSECEVSSYNDYWDDETYIQIRWVEA